MRKPYTPPRPAQKNTPTRGSRRGRQQKGRFSIFPILLSATLILGGVYWLWSYGNTTQSPLLAWLSGGNANVYTKVGDRSRTESRDLYLQAVEAQNAEEYELAKKLFLELEDSYPGLKNLISWHLVDIYTEIPREDLVQIRLRKLKEEGNLQPNFIAEVDYALLKSHIRANQLDLSAKLNKTIQKDYPNTDFANAAKYYEGLALLNKHDELWKAQHEGGDVQKTGLPNPVRELWDAYLKASPTGTFAIPIIDTIKARKVIPSINEMTYMIQAYSHAGKHTEALTLAKKQAYNVKDAGIDVIHSQVAMGNQAQSIVLLKYWSPEYMFDAQTFNDVLKTLFPTTSKPTPARLKDLNQILAISQGNNREQLLWHLSQYDEAQQAKHYQQFNKDYSKSKLVPFVSSELIRFQFEAGNNVAVISETVKYLEQFPASLEAPLVSLWKALALRANHNVAGSNTEFEKILTTYPHTFAAFRAHHYLNASDDEDSFNPVWKPSHLPLISNTLHSPIEWLDEYAEKHDDLAPILVAQLSELAAIKAFDDILLLLNMYLSPESAHYAALTSWAYLVDGQHDQSIRIIRDHIGSLDRKVTVAERYQLSKPVLKLLYPLHYPSLVEKASENAGVSPFLTLGLMRQESNFNPNSVSGSAAVGLMQLLVPTAQDMVLPKENTRVSKLTLFDPETNIRYGTRYLAYLKRILHNDPLLVVASYNAGPGAVGGWANANMTTLRNSPDMFVEKIPYDQTRHYVHHVFEGMWNYYNLYHVD